MRIPCKPTKSACLRSAAAAQTTTLREPRPLEGPFLHVQPRRPCNLQEKRAPGYIRHKTVRGGRTCANSRCGHAYITIACVLPWQVFRRWRLQSPEGRLSIDGDFNRLRGLYSQAVLHKMPGASSFPRPAATVSQARWRDGNGFRGGATTGTSPREDYGRL